MSQLPVITVWQPWATLIVLRAKPFEFRKWEAPRAHRSRRIGIHAAARPVRREEVADLLMRLRRPDAWTTCLCPDIAIPILEKAHASPGILPLSHMLGSAVLGTPVRSHEVVGEFGGVINDSDRDEHCNWAWPLSDIRYFEPPVPAKGAQGFWKWTAPADLREVDVVLRPPFRAGDHVAHGPTGETWVVAYADPATGYMAWCGWPEGEAKTADCTLVKAASDGEHQQKLRELKASGGRRAVRALRLYGEPVANGGDHG